MKTLIIISAAALMSGCVATRITKETRVHRDPNGKITEIVEIERVEQQTEAQLIKLEHLKLK